MTDTGESQSRSSSVEDFSILDPDVFQEIADTTPAFAFTDDDFHVIQQPFEIEEDDLSGYVNETVDGDEQLPTSGEFLQPPASYADSISSESVSPTSIFSPLTISSPYGDFADLLGETDDVEISHGGSHKKLSQTVEGRWNSIYSYALKEEIRYKIQLKRVTSGQEELKVDFTAPDTTICYDTVKKRNEVREKNKEYARQSRDRIKFERKHLEQVNQRLKQKNAEARKEIIQLKQMMMTTDDLLCRHHEECPMCCQAENRCSICSKKIKPTIAFPLFKSSPEPEKTVCIGKIPRDSGPEPGSSGLSKVKNYHPSSRSVTKSGNMIVWNYDNETQYDKRRHTESKGKGHLIFPRYKVQVRDDVTSSNADNDTQDDKDYRTLIRGKRRAVFSNPKVQVQENLISSNSDTDNETQDDNYHLTALRGKRREIVPVPKAPFHS